MHHCHPCFGGHKPVGPICTTAPVIHPTKQCVTHSFSTTVVPHIFPTHTTHVHHQQIKNQGFFPQTNSNVNVVDPGDPGFGGGSVGGFGGGCGPCGHGHHHHGHQISPYGPGPNVSPYGPGPNVSPYGPGPNVSPFGPNVGGMFKK
ncbi:CotD family spore coat protein [Bacillus mycoides]|uniref:CotD family spore coat protein n=1 Tax=Bacillus mycoides TaxID=1405 RepID=UPI0003E234D7|nr:CotD family spore coat protein [Bacillus mycoides]ETT78204.1 spore coat protein D [Bacillus mycoides FSL H7-687]MCQ6534178.1 spore coat protein [Bacillus mycoides]PGA14562.1 spore coat protein [Bacillus mycoides]QWI10352.1 spore coat protein [Bacillus mycoides]QWI54775.1 spore coat protein [Bacillus mycoides]